MVALLFFSKRIIAGDVEIGYPGNNGMIFTPFHIRFGCPGDSIRKDIPFRIR